MVNTTGGSEQTHTVKTSNAGYGIPGVMHTPMIDRAMRQLDYSDHEVKSIKPTKQPEMLLQTIRWSLQDIYEWACENQKENQGLLYDLNTAIAAVERCGVKIKDGR